MKVALPVEGSLERQREAVVDVAIHGDEGHDRGD
jgi:hypothetical protein